MIRRCWWWCLERSWRMRKALPGQLPPGAATLMGSDGVSRQEWRGGWCCCRWWGFRSLLVLCFKIRCPFPKSGYDMLQCPPPSSYSAANWKEQQQPGGGYCCWRDCWADDNDDNDDAGKDNDDGDDGKSSSSLRGLLSRQAAPSADSTTPTYCWTCCFYFWTLHFVLLLIATGFYFELPLPVPLLTLLLLNFLLLLLNFALSAFLIVVF